MILKLMKKDPQFTLNGINNIWIVKPGCILSCFFLFINSI